MRTAYQTFVISLARAADKHARFLERNAATSLRFERFDAVDGRALSRAEAVSTGWIADSAQHYTAGAIGCAASHLALWQRAVQSQTNFLIFEDDVHCRHDIAVKIDGLLTSLKDWDVILLGYNTDAVLDFAAPDGSRVSGFMAGESPTPEALEMFAQDSSDVAAARLNNAFGLCAYLVSPRGAAALAGLFPRDNRSVLISANKPKFGTDTFTCMTIDLLTNTLYRQLQAYVPIPPLALALNEKATSTTRR